MLHQRTRDLYFAALLPFNKFNYWRWRWLGRRANGSDLHLHLGCGPKYLSGFVNVDGNLFRRHDLWLDLRNGLPFTSDSVASIYSSHVFEHFYPDELERLIASCRRVLRPGGGMRIVVPDMAAAVRAYLDGDESFFTDFPRPHASLGGKLSNLLFCEGGHRQGLDFSYFEELLRLAGFSELSRVEPAASRIYSGGALARIAEEEAGVSHISLIVECRK